MARTARTPLVPSYGGTVVAFTAVDATNGESFGYGGGTRKLLVNNASGASITVTLRRNFKTVDGGTPPDQQVTVAAGTIQAILEGPTEQQSDGTVWVDYSSGTTVTAMLLQG